MNRAPPVPKDAENPLDQDESFLRYRSALRRFFSKRVRPGQDVEDLVQDVFSRLASRRSSEAIDSPDAYIFQIASNLLRDEARREGTRRVATDSMRHLDEGDFEARSPERVLQGKEQVLALEKALKELPERTRAIFVLSRFEELSYAEIGERLSVSKSLVEKCMMDAIRHLHYRLRGH
jgi:RNA polymerase sigma factor (sigma-70 family)